jgi:hypothetical protein
LLLNQKLGAHMKNPKLQRRYDLDWLRVIAFTILILFHTGMMFNTWGWHIKNKETSEALEYVMIFFNQWRMPLLFFISGAAVWFALERYSMRQFIAERNKRLLLPLVFGMFVIIPPQVYFERIFQGQTYGFGEFYKIVLQLQPYPEGNFSWHHLWYIPYILVFSFVTIPLFRYLKSEKGKIKLDRLIDGFDGNSFIFLWFIPIAISEMSLRPFWPDNANNLLGDWAQFTSTLIIFCHGYFLASHSAIWTTIEKNRFRALGFGLAAVSILYVIWFSDYEANKFEYAIYRTLRSFNIWCWILTALGFGKRHLSRNSSFLKYANEAVYPFYILHQTITVVLGYYLIDWPAGIPLKFFVVASGTFLGCWIIYEFLIKGNNLMRLAFGIKVRKAHQQPARQVGQRAVSSYGME